MPARVESLLRRASRVSRWPVLIVALLGLAGCAALVGRASERMAQDLGRAVLDQDDPATVRDGLPAYLLLLDGMIAGDPDNPGLRLAAADLYAAYAGSFVEDGERARRLSSRALEHAWIAQCGLRTPMCDARPLRHDAVLERIAAVEAGSLRALYALGGAWAVWIQAHREDWNAIADIPKVEAVLARVVELDPSLDHGNPQVYLGVLNSLRPAAVGGRPDEGRRWFEQAIALSGGRNLMARTLLAEFYARLVFDQALHDRLLHEVLAADARAPGLTLSNTLAQERARELLAGSVHYF